MKIPFYQTSWNSVDLINLAHELGHPLSELPTNRFYDAYYAAITENQENLPKDWKEAKKNQTHWLAHKIDTLVGKNSQVLSVGAGTGIIELPLIEAGYEIHLQEFQKKSLEIFNLSKVTKLYDDISVIGHNQYAMVVTIAMTYALDDKSLKMFFDSCREILHKNGVLVILDTSLSWKEVYSYVRNKKYYEINNLFWGYKRSMKDYSRFSSNFRLDAHVFYDENMQEIQPIMFFGIPLNITPCWQMMVFKKND